MNDEALGVTKDLGVEEGEPQLETFVAWWSFIWARRDRRSWRVPTATNEEASRDSRRTPHRCSPKLHPGEIIIMVR